MAKSLKEHSEPVYNSQVFIHGYNLSIVELIPSGFDIKGQKDITTTNFPQNYIIGGNNCKRRETNEKTKEDNIANIIISNLLAECGQAL